MANKTNTKKILLIAAFMMIIIASLFYLVITGYAAKEEKIKIGIILPLSGSSALIGEGMRDAIILAHENNVNNKDYELIFEDDSLNPKETVNAVNKLINIDKVDAIISVSSGPGNVVSPITEQNKVLHISLASDPNIAKGNYNFIHWTTPKEENRVFIKELKERGIKKVAVIRQNHPGAEALLQNMKEQAKAEGIEIDEELFDTGQKDFRTIIIKQEKRNPDIYFILAYSPELELIAKQIKELGIAKPLTSIEAFEVTENLKLFEGMWYVMASSPNNEFREEFKKAYGQEPGYGSANAYDAYNLIIKAFENAKTSKEAADNLRGIKNFSGALGILNVGEDNIIQSKAVVREIKNGVPVTISDSP